MKRSRGEPSALEEDNSRKKRNEADMISAELLPVKCFIESIQNTLQAGEHLKHSTDFDTNTDSEFMEGSTSVLWIASSKGHIEVVNHLIKLNGVNIDHADKNKVTPLMEASRSKHHDVVHALLMANAKTDAEDRNGWTALHMAAQGGNADIVEELIYPNKDILNKDILNKMDKNNVTPLMVACQNGHVQVVRSLLTAKAIVDAEDTNGWTALHMAADRGNKDIVEALVNHNNSLLEKKNKNSVTPLMMASHNGRDSVVEFLLDANANTDAEDADGWTALHFAAHGGNEKIINRLVAHNRGILDKKTKNEGSTALYIAVAQGQCKAVETLLHLKADAKQEDEIKKFTVLHAAAESGYSNTLEILLKDEVVKTMINVGDKRWKRTPVLLAAWKGSIKCVQLLCQEKADVLKRTEGGYTAMHWAAALGHTEVIKILYNAKADITALNKAKETPIDLARRGRHISAVTLLKDYAAIQKQLITATEDGNLTEVRKGLLECYENINFECQSYDNPAGFEALECGHSEILRTLKCNKIMKNCNWKNIALLLASYEGNVSKVSYLLDNGAKIDTITEQGWTPLMIASESGKEHIVEYLILKGADVNAVTQWKQSALLFAAWGNYGRILQMLINAKADVSLTTSGGWTAYQWALTLDHETAILVLEQCTSSESLMKPNEKSKDTIHNLVYRRETCLNSTDHHVVFEETKKASESWRAIGRELRFQMRDLDSITHESGRNYDADYYEAMLKKWMDRADVTAEQLSLALHSIGYQSLARDFLSKMKIFKRSRLSVQRDNSVI